MSASIASRTLLRQTNRNILARRTRFRWASTTEKVSEGASQAAAKTKETASNIQSKASEGLTKVKSSGGSAMAGVSNAGNRVVTAVRGLGGPIGRMVGAVESAIPPIIYYSKVGFELGKLVFNGQRMAPPPLSAITTHLSTILSTLRNPSSLLRSAPAAAEAASPESLLSRARNINRASLAAGGVVLAELLGFFTVGEMLGRLKLVGYHGDVQHGSTEF